MPLYEFNSKLCAIMKSLGCRVRDGGLINDTRLPARYLLNIDLIPARVGGDESVIGNVQRDVISALFELGMEPGMFNETRRYQNGINPFYSLHFELLRQSVDNLINSSLVAAH